MKAAGAEHGATVRNFRACHKAAPSRQRGFIAEMVSRRLCVRKVRGNSRPSQSSALPQLCSARAEFSSEDLSCSSRAGAKRAASWREWETPAFRTSSRRSWPIWYAF